MLLVWQPRYFLKPSTCPHFQEYVFSLSHHPLSLWLLHYPLCLLASSAALRASFRGSWPVQFPRALHSKEPLSVTLCCHHLAILNIFIFELVFCKWSPVGQQSTCVSRGDKRNIHVCHFLLLCGRSIFKSQRKSNQKCGENISGNSVIDTKGKEHFRKEEVVSMVRCSW